MDNIQYDFPARMSDGRFMTDYRPNCTMNGVLQKGMSSFQYRTYLTNYSDRILGDINSLNNSLYKCNSCVGTVPVEAKYEQSCDVNGVCGLNMVNPMGIGTKNIM